MSEVRDISGIIALVATTLIGITIPLIGIAWRGMTNTYFKLIPIERQKVGRMTFWIITFTLIVLGAEMVAGVSNPQLAPWASLFTLLLIMAVISIIDFGRWTYKKIMRVKQEQPVRIKDSSSSLYCLSLSFLSISIMFNLFALIGIGAAMLNIQIGPYQLDNYNWGRWSMLNGMFLFVVSVPAIGCANLMYHLPRELDSNRKNV